MEADVAEQSSATVDVGPKKKRSRLQKDFDKDFEKSRFGTSGNDKGMVEGGGLGAEGGGLGEEASGGLLEGAGDAVGGGLASLAIGAALPEIIGAVLAAGAVTLIGGAIYKHFHDNPDSKIGPNGKPYLSPEAYGGTTTANGDNGPNGRPYLSPETYGGTTITNGKIEPSPSTTGMTIEQQLQGTSHSIVAPITNNIVNNNGSSGGNRSADMGMPSVRTLDPSFVRWQDKRQSRVF